MAATLVVLFLLFIPFVAVEAQKKPSHVISLGSSLNPITNKSWFSPSRVFAFGFYPERDGFAVGIWLVGKPNNTVVWTANRDNPPVSSNSKVEFTRTGLLVLSTDQGGGQTIGNPAASAAMLDSGNFVLYDKNFNSVWESFDSPTDTMLGGQRLRTLTDNDHLVSSVSSSDHSSGRYVLRLRNDGVLAAFLVQSSQNVYVDAYWTSGIMGFNDLQLDINGSVSIRNSTSIIRTFVEGDSLAKNVSIIYRATLCDDGNFRLYSHSFGSLASQNVSIKWSLLPDRCQVYGFCGYNSYCSSNGTEVDCYCFPGFDFIDRSKKSLGCYRNLSEDPCISNKGLKMSNTIITFENLTWGDFSYSMIPMKKEDCEKSCFEDCNCVAALYYRGFCRKQKLPLIYGRTNLDKSITAFVKKSSETANVSDTSLGSPIRRTVVTENKKGLITILSVSLGSIACLCFVIALSSFATYKHRIHRYRKLFNNAKFGLNEEFTLRSFSYNELEKATEGFKEELGKGSFGTVYRGTLCGGNKIVAVKRLENVSEEGDREFQSEVTAIGQTHHRNLVRLLGFCVEGSRKLLVYEYMSNGSLANLLFNAERHPSLRDRLKIALDIARGILYLHEEREACIIHCNIKPQNILMDDSWTAKISDFGLAKLLMPHHIRSITGRGGTGSYLAPEWQKHALISVKVDIYSFGVVLLEIVCCRCNIQVNASNEDEILLSYWVYKCFEGGELNKLAEDERADLRTLQRMVKVGLWCIQDDPNLRPSMKKVIMMLEGTVDIAVPPNPSPSLLHS